MNPESLRQKLIACARTQVPPDSVPYAFERRVMARVMAPLPRTSGQDAWSFWGAALWRAVAPCLAITLLVAFSAFALGAPTEDTSEPLESLLLANMTAQIADTP